MERLNLEDDYPGHHVADWPSPAGSRRVGGRENRGGLSRIGCEPGFPRIFPPGEGK